MTDYIIKVSANQMRIIQNALEYFFRVRMGQFFDLAHDIAFEGFNYKNHLDEEFSERAERRIAAETLFDKGYLAATGGEWRIKTPDVENAIDIWHVIRHQRWKDNPNRSDCTMDACEPFQIAGEPLCTVERIEE